MSFLQNISFGFGFLSNLEKAVTGEFFGNGGDFTPVANDFVNAVRLIFKIKGSVSPSTIAELAVILKSGARLLKPMVIKN